MISREVHFVEINEAGEIRAGGYAPYLDYEPATEEQLALLKTTGIWNKQEYEVSFEEHVLAYAIEHLVPRHLARIRKRREELVDKILVAVHECLTKEINYWDKRSAELRQKEKTNSPRIT